LTQLSVVDAWLSQDGGRHTVLSVELRSKQSRLLYLTQELPAYKDAHAAGREAERHWAARMSAFNSNAPWAKSRDYCEREAAAIWASNPDLRISEMARVLWDSLEREGLKVPTKPDKVAEWLRDAANDSRLTIPPQAQKGGRPRKD
jgi:hypothetical protein